MKFLLLFIIFFLISKNTEPAIWNPGICSDGLNTTQEDCESSGETWSNPVCDTIGFIHSQSECENLTEDTTINQPCPDPIICPESNISPECPEPVTCPESNISPECPEPVTCPESNISQECPEPVTCPECPPTHFAEYYFIYLMITLILSIYTLYLSFVINNGFNLSHFIMACCCWPFYLPYAIFSKP
jgi:hypothetical protein